MTQSPDDSGQDEPLDRHSTARRTAARLGRFGVWSNALSNTDSSTGRSMARQVEELGYGSIWIGETPRLGREAATHAAILLAATGRLVVATGIANIWLRQPAAMTAAAHTMAEAYPGRFVLGIGASHAEALALTGQNYERPLTAMREYLEAMRDSGSYFGPASAEPLPVVVAALRSRMQELARDQADGMHSFFATPEHTRAARACLGAGPLLVPEQAVIVETDPDIARRRARKHVQSRLALPNYVRHARELGYTNDDLADGGSDALVDAFVAWGDAERVTDRIRDHLEAGADHVAVHPLEHREDPLGVRQLAELAPWLFG